MKRLFLILPIVLFFIFGCASGDNSVLVIGVGSDDLVKAVSEAVDKIPTSSDAAGVLSGVLTGQDEAPVEQEKISEEVKEPEAEVQAPEPLGDTTFDLIRSPKVDTGVPEQSYIAEIDGKKVLVLLNIGQHNGGLSSFNDTRDKSKFPGKFLLTVVGCYKDKEIVYNGTRYEEGSKDLVIRPSESKWAMTGTALMTRCSSETAYLVL